MDLSNLPETWSQQRLGRPEPISLIYSLVLVEREVLIINLCFRILQSLLDDPSCVGWRWLELTGLSVRAQEGFFF